DFDHDSIERFDVKRFELRIQCFACLWIHLQYMVVSSAVEWVGSG
ncbi:MAG: hypothetical protein ACI87E_001737, partial [Mariniblastus sp.]